MSKLLIDEYPLQVLPSLAVIYGLNEAIILQQVHYWIKDRKAVIGELDEQEAGLLLVLPTLLGIIAALFYPRRSTRPALTIAQCRLAIAKPNLPKQRACPER